jgi:hypothetical protein
MSAPKQLYEPDAWFLNVTAMLGLLTVVTNLCAVIRAMKVRLQFEFFGIYFTLIH